MPLVRWIILISIVISPFCALAQSADDRRNVRNVTPGYIPVIILPPRDNAQKDRWGKPDETPSSENRLTAFLSENGVVTASGNVLRFFGATLVPPSTLCEDPAGSRWACGLRAYIALRNFIHGKEIRCAATEFKIVPTSRCFREQHSISNWLLSEGWATYDEAAKDKVLSRVADEARRHAKGIWSNGSVPVVLQQ